MSGLKYTLCNQCCLSNGVEVICTTGQLVPLFPNTLDRINCIYRLFMGGGHAKGFMPEKQSHLQKQKTNNAY